MILDLVPAPVRPRGDAETGRRVGALAEPTFQMAALAYQPVVALRTGAVCGLIASVRRRAIPDISTSIVATALAQACVDARYFPDLRMSIRISARQFENGTLLGHVDTALAISGLPPARLEIELSEIGRFDPASLKLATLQALRDRGVGIVLGGYGASGASVLLLRRLPFTAVKLDHRLIHGLPLDAKACARVGTLLDARRETDVLSIADGVETLAQRDFLNRRGCDAATGPLYSRPVSPERLTALLDYGVDTCSPPRSGSETQDDRAVPY